MVLAGIVAVYFGAATLGPALSASRDDGTKGYFVARSESCVHETCTWAGDFQLPDGTVTRTSVVFNADPSWMHDDSVAPALATGDRRSVYPRDDSLAWVQPVLALTIPAGLLIAVAASYRRRPHGRHAKNVSTRGRPARTQEAERN